MTGSHRNIVSLVLGIALVIFGVCYFFLRGKLFPAGLAILPGLLLLIVSIPKLQIHKITSNHESKGPLELENEYRQTLVQILGGAALIATVYTAFDNAKIAHESITQSTRSYELARHGQISERILKAMEMLSKEKNIDAKVAAIHVLEQVAIEDPQSEWLITETLSDYLRLHSQWPARSRKHLQEAPDDVGTIFVFLRRRPWKIAEGEEKDKCVEYHQCVDYQAGKKPNEDDADYLKEINLPGADLRYAYLDRVMLKKAILNRAHLENARLRYSHCENVYAEDAYFNDADLRDSYWILANLKDAHLEGVRPAHADFERSYAEGSSLNNVDLSDSYWVGANLKNAHLERVRLSHAHFENTYAEGSNLNNAKLTNSYWSNASLKNADLTCSQWSKADMKDAYLDGAKLYGADLTGAINLTKKQLERARGDSLTKLSDEGLRPSTWDQSPQANCGK